MPSPFFIVESRNIRGVPFWHEASHSEMDARSIAAELAENQFDVDHLPLERIWRFDPATEKLANVTKEVLTLYVAIREGGFGLLAHPNVRGALDRAGVIYDRTPVPYVRDDAPAPPTGTTIIQRRAA